MPLPLRPIAVVVAIGTLSVLLAGCTAGDDARPSASASASRDSAGRTPAAPATGPGSGTQTADSSGVPTSVAGTEPANPQPTATFAGVAVVTYAAWDDASSTLQAGGLVTGTSDASGTCTFTARSGGTTRTATSTPNAGSGSVSCAQATFPKAQIGHGSWAVTLTYSAAGSSTVSTPTTAEVP